MALTNPAPGQEAAFNAWDDDFHLREVVEYDSGRQAGRRYRLAAEQRATQPRPPWEYLAVYKVEARDAAAVHAAASGRDLTKPPAGAFAPGQAVWLFEPYGRPGRPI